MIGWVLGRFGFRPRRSCSGLILGPLAEQGFVQAWMIGSASEDLLGMFFARPISLAIMAIAALTLLYPIYTRRMQRKRDAADAQG